MSVVMSFLATYSEVLSLVFGLLIATVWQFLRDKWNHRRETSAQLRTIRLDMHAELLAEARQFRLDMSHMIGKGVDPGESQHRPFKENSRSVNDLLPRIELVGSRAAHEAAAKLVDACNDLSNSATAGALSRVANAEEKYLRAARQELGIDAR